MKIILLNEHNQKNIPSKNHFQRWVNATIQAIPEKIPSSITDVCIAIVDKKTSAELNETYRQKKGPTNVLSFHYAPTPGISQESLGDLAICAKLVESEALMAACTTRAHWAHLTVHGILHLAGYDHIVESEAKTMETLETQILNRLGYKDPYL